MWVAASSHMLLSLGTRLSPQVEHLREATVCLAQLSKWGYRLSYSDWWATQPRVVMRFTALAYKCQYHMVHAIDVDKSALSNQAGQLHTAWQNYLHYTLFHAVLDIQILPLILSECERAEQNNRPCRSIANTCSSQKLPNIVSNIVERLQVENIVKAEDAPKATTGKDGRGLHLHYTRSVPEGIDERRMEFGKEYWRDDANWPFLVRTLSYLLVLQPRCWSITGQGDDAIFLLHTTVRDAVPDGERLHFGLPSGTAQVVNSE